jgi:Protein of unknown function (DUF3429)
MTESKKIWPGRSGQILAWLGTLPFVIALLVSLTPYRLHVWPFLVVIVSTYAAMIVTFIAGTHWGLSSHLPENKANKVMICSNLITLFAWLGILFPSWLISWMIVLTCYWLAFAVDKFIYRHSGIDSSYLNMRLKVTIFVTVILLFLVFLGRFEF